MSQERTLSEVQSAIIRVYHPVDLVAGCSPKIADAEGQTIVDLTMFKTIKITDSMNTNEVVQMLSQKLKMDDSSQFTIYSIDPQFNKSKCLCN